MRRKIGAFSFLIPLQVLAWQAEAPAGPLQPPRSEQETHRLGERMYREGILPSGKTIQVVMPDDQAVPGTVFTCASCHLRSGLGATEEGVYYPPVNGALLFKKFQPDRKRGIEGTLLRGPLQHQRPAYSEKGLAEALRRGLDPAGRTLSQAMPRYILNDEEMGIMISYLKSLSSQYSPGVSETNLRFATVITDDVGPEERDEALASLLGLITARDRKARLLKQLAVTVKNPMFEGEMASKSQPVTLTPWFLSGPPETWRAQLEEYNRKEPVFALLGGVTKGEWEPIHRFSEENRIPCIFPDTDFPVISQNDWYTLYISKGYYQEGEAAARFLAAAKEVQEGKPVVQIVRESREGRALSRGFEENWRDLDQRPPVTVTLKPGEKLTADTLREMLRKHKPAAVVLWDGPNALPALEDLASQGVSQAMVYISSTYVGEGFWSIKEPVREFTLITYPFRLPKDTSSAARLPRYLEVGRAANQAYSINQILSMALMEMKDNYYRDTFMDVIGMSDEVEVPLYERLNFGSGRYASKGCYIVKLAKGENPKLVPEKEWLLDMP